jgi:hypothetical protein
MAVAHDTEVSKQSKFETITANRLAIEKGSLIAGNISFQIRNIVSLLVFKYKAASDAEAKRYGLLAALAFGVIALSITRNLVAGAIATLVGGVAAYIYRGETPAEYQLRVITSAGTSFSFFNQSEEFLLKLKTAIEEAMHDGTAYQINISNHEIKELQANTTNVINSANANVIGGNAPNARQSTNVVTQGVQNIDALISLIERSNDQYKNFFIQELETVRDYASGGRSKEEAKTSWNQVVKYARYLLGVGIDISTFARAIKGLLA